MTLDRIPFVKRKFPSWLKGLLSAGIIIFCLSIVFDILTSNINELTHSYKKYETNIDYIIEQINLTLGIDLAEVVKTQSGNLQFGKILTSIFNSLSGLIGNTFMMILFSLFVLLEESNFQAKLKLIFEDKKRYARFNKIMQRVEESVSSYFKLKAFVSLVTGGLSYIALRIIGVDSPEFWAFLIFILNFIPTIGSLIGTVFPAFFCLLQFGEFTPSLLVLIIVGLIQIVVGNILEPRLMGSSMNICLLYTSPSPRDS